MAFERTIVIAQGKGGVGKTSLTANVAGLAAAAGLHVLAIDLDPQGNLARDLGYPPHNGDELLGALMAGSTAPLLTDVRPGLDVVPGGPALADASAVALSRTMRSEDNGLGRMLHTSFTGLVEPYDLILVDTPPGERTIVEAALEIASAVLVPTRTDEASLDGLKVLATRFAAARARNADLRLAGVALFAVGARSRRMETTVRRAVEEIIGKSAPIFDTRIRHLESAAVDARRRGLLVHELEDAAAADVRARLAALRAGKHPESELLVRNASGLASDYESFTRELLTRIGELETEEGAA